MKEGSKEWYERTPDSKDCVVTSDIDVIVDLKDADFKGKAYLTKIYNGFCEGDSPLVFKGDHITISATWNNGGGNILPYGKILELFAEYGMDELTAKRVKR